MVPRGLDGLSRLSLFHLKVFAYKHQVYGRAHTHTHTHTHAQIHHTIRMEGADSLRLRASAQYFLFCSGYSDSVAGLCQRCLFFNQRAAPTSMRLSLSACLQLGLRFLPCVSGRWVVGGMWAKVRGIRPNAQPGEEYSHFIFTVTLTLPQLSLSHFG